MSVYVCVCGGVKTVSYWGREARAPVHAGWQGSQPSQDLAHCTHLSYFSRGDLPLVGASEGTGDIPVEKQEERCQ